MSDYKNLKITMVKFYQGVMVHDTNNQVSSKVVTERTTTNRNLVSIEKTNDGVMIITTDYNERTSYTEVPYNNLAYINYEPQTKQDREQKSQKSSNAVKPKPASSEQ